MIWKRLYNQKAAREKRTLYQLKNLINRTAVKSDPSKCMKAAEDFFTVVLYAYIMAAARKIMAKSTSLPSCIDVARQVVSNYITLTLPDSTASTYKGNTYGYGLDVLNLGLMWLGFHDAVREGDGDRIVRYWRFLLPVFHHSKRRNHSLEALNLLVQMITLSPRQVAEIKWNRTVNTVGRRGHSVPCDLHMEHLKRRLKFMMANLGSNISKPQCVEEISKCLGVVAEICTKFEQEAEIYDNKDFHTFPSFQKDLTTILEQLTAEDLLDDSNPKILISYKKSPIVQSINLKKLTTWVGEKIINLDLW